MSLKDAPPPELSIFVVTPSSHVNGPAADLSDINGVSCRKRRKHSKSHSGCLACKRRRVKCDSTSRSCRPCTRRGEICSLSRAPETFKNAKPPPSAASDKHHLPHQQIPSNVFPVGLDPLQGRLFNNFVTNTAATLPFGRNVWNESIVTLALEHDYLMHAILLISASHLSYMSPDKSEYQQASLFHLSKVLPRYRKEVSRALSTENADIAMAVSFLMIYYAWSNVDSFDMNDRKCFISDPLFAMTGGLRESFISATLIISSGRSIFSESIAYRPKDTIDEIAQRCSQTPAHFEQSFCEEYYARGNHGIMDIRDDSIQNIPEFSDILASGQQVDNNYMWYSVTRPHDSCLVGFLDASVRLAPLCSIASEVESTSHAGQSCEPIVLQGGSSSKATFAGPLPITDLARYIYTWPYICSPGVLHLLARKDGSIILLLYRFYKTIKALLPEEYWWAHQRADKMITVFKETLAENLHSLKRYSQVPPLPQSMVIRATSFASQANKAWRHYSILYGLDTKAQK